MLYITEQVFSGITVSGVTKNCSSNIHLNYVLKSRDRLRLNK